MLASSSCWTKEVREGFRIQKWFSFKQIQVLEVLEGFQGVLGGFREVQMFLEGFYKIFERFREVAAASETAPGPLSLPTCNVGVRYLLCELLNGKMKNWHTLLAAQMDWLVFLVASAFRPVWPGRCIVLSLSLCTTSRLAPCARGESNRGWLSASGPKAIGNTTTLQRRLVQMDWLEGFKLVLGVAPEVLWIFPQFCIFPAAPGHSVNSWQSSVKPNSPERFLLAPTNTQPVRRQCNFRLRTQFWGHLYMFNWNLADPKLALQKLFFGGGVCKCEVAAARKLVAIFLQKVCRFRDGLGKNSATVPLWATAWIHENLV